MDSKNIKLLLSMLGIHKYIDRTDWVMATCPFSIYHEKGTDDKASFGIRKASYSGFHCFACDAHGSLINFPERYKQKMGTDLHPTITKLILETEGKWKEDDTSTKRNLLAMPNSILQRFSILNSYGSISGSSISSWGLRYDKKENRMVIPIYDKNQRLVGIRGRSLDKEPRIKFRMYNELNPDSADPKGAGVWLGMQFPLQASKDLVLVEGDRDAILLKQAGVSNVWASLGASISREQLNNLRNVPNRLVLFFDNDKAGMVATKKVLDTCTGLMPIKVVKKYFGMKDPAELVENNLIRTVFS